MNHRKYNFTIHYTLLIGNYPTKLELIIQTKIKAKSLHSDIKKKSEN